MTNCSFRNTILDFKFEIILSYSVPMLLGEHSFLPIEYLSLVLCVLQLLIANIVYLKQEFQDCPIIV